MTDIVFMHLGRELPAGATDFPESKGPFTPAHFARPDVSSVGVLDQLIRRRTLVNRLPVTTSFKMTGVGQPEAQSAAVQPKASPSALRRALQKFIPFI